MPPPVLDPDAQAVRRRWTRRLLKTLAVVAALVVVGIALRSTGKRVHHYVTEDADFCRTCHADQMAATVDPSHQNLACSECHRVGFWSGAYQYVLNKVSGGKKSTPHSEPDRSRCLTCHQDRLDGVRLLSRTVGHRSHLFGKVKLGCEECHGRQAHVYRVQDTECSRCHTELKVEHAGMQDVPCLSCHNFLASTLGADREPRIDCRPCHGGNEFAAPPGQVLHASAQVVNTSQVHGSLDSCQLCHDPHAAAAAERTKGQTCSDCHTHVTSERHQQQQPQEFDCNSCHTTHIERSEFRGACVRCHKQPKSNPDQPLLAVTHKSCTDCHAAHDFQANRSRCLSCHEEQRDQVQAWQAREHSDCLSCHAPHVAGAEQKRCARCHQKRPGRGHQSCIDCHDPHQGRQAMKPCASCHEKPPVELLAGNSRHGQDCAACHPPHSNQSGRSRCAACHEQTRLVTRARPKEHRQCETCHKPHRFSTDPRVCDSCHEVAADGPHQGPCQKCHQPHGPPKPRGGCKSCHAKEAREARLGKHKCADCHAPHKPAVDWWTKCSACHRAEVKASRSRGKTHGNCQSCHKPHAFQTPACTSCHKERGGNHSRSGHQSCLRCHDSHAKKRPTRRTCLSCHRDLTDHNPDAKRCTGCHPFR